MIKLVEPLAVSAEAIELLDRLEAQLLDHQQSHVSWADHFRAEPKAKCGRCTPDVIAGVGDLKHQEKVIADYDWMIAGVRRLRSDLQPPC